MKNYFTTLSLILICVALNGQSLSDARSFYNSGNFPAALAEFEKLLKDEPDDSYLNQMAGECVLKINGDPAPAVEYLKKSISAKRYDNLALYLMAEAYAQNYEFDLAIDYYNHYLKTVSKKLSPDIQKRIIDCQTAKEMVKYPIEVTFNNLGPEINSEYPDYNPYVSNDESVLLFNSRRKRGNNEVEFDGFYPADIYESGLEENTLKNAQLVGSHVTTQYDDVLVGMAGDASEIFVYYDDIDFYGDIFISKRNRNSFMQKKPFDEINQPNDMETAATISPDGNAIVFASDRPDGLGMTDLYIIRKMPDGNWSEPQNLGPEVNTHMAEDYPQFSPDGRYLYFSSNGHPGMGGFDVYLTEWNTENNIWTKAKNMGYPLNTPADNRSISFNEDGSSAYVSVWRPDSQGNLDIYRADLKERGNLPALVRIQVPTGNVSTPFINAEITVTDQYDELVGIYRPHPKSGKYVMALNPGKYFLYMDAEGYQPYSELMMISDYYAQAEQNIKVIRLNGLGK